VPALARRALAELTGTWLLVAVVVGSGIMATRLSPGDTGVELLENTLATVAGLAVLIVVFGPVSGAHLNPLVSAADWALGRRTGTGLRGRDLAVYGAVPGGRCDRRCGARQPHVRAAGRHRVAPRAVRAASVAR